MDITGTDVAAALRGLRAMSKMTVGAVVSEVASITGDSERTIHRRLDTGAGLEIDMVCAFAKVLGVSASHIYKIAAA
jgi:hypothetical protein